VPDKCLNTPPPILKRVNLAAIDQWFQAARLKRPFELAREGRVVRE
jgi:hypothetical protein